MKPLAWAVVVVAAAGAGLARPAASAAESAVPRLQADTPRAFGHQVGDLVERRVTLWLPSGWRLDEASVPKPGGRGRAVELRQVQAETEAAMPGGTWRAGGERRVDIRLEYQVFLAPAAPRLVEVPSFVLRVASDRRQDELRVDAAPLLVAPLVGAEVPARNGFGELRPDRDPPLVDTGAWPRRLALWGLLALVPLSWLFAVHVGAPWNAARQRPFSAAWRALRRLPAQPSGAEWRAALRRLHAALDQAAGETVFEHRLPAFFEAAPRYRPLAPALTEFLTVSRQEFFAAAPAAEPRGRWLVDLSRSLRDAERSGLVSAPGRSVPALQAGHRSSGR